MQRTTDRAKASVGDPIRCRPVRAVLVTAASAVLLGFLAGKLTERKTT